MKKTIIKLESIGSYARLTLQGGNEIDENRFSNLVWAMNGTLEMTNSFVCSKEKLSSAIKTFRIANIWQARRGKNLWKESPYIFEVITQQNFKKSNGKEFFKVGEYQDLENPWQNYKPSIAKHFNQ